MTNDAAREDVAIAVAAAELPDDALVIVPVRNLVLFPGLIVPVAIGRQRSIAGAQYAVKHERPVGIVLQTNPEAELPGPDDMAQVGTIAAILRYVSTPDGKHHLICQGQQRFKVLGYLDGHPFTVARIERITPAPEATDSDIEARLLRLRARAIEVLKLLPQAQSHRQAGLARAAGPAPAHGQFAGADGPSHRSDAPVARD